MASSHLENVEKNDGTELFFFLILHDFSLLGLVTLVHKSMRYVYCSTQYASTE